MFLIRLHCVDMKMLLLHLSSDPQCHCNVTVLLSLYVEGVTRQKQTAQSLESMNGRPRQLKTSFSLFSLSEKRKCPEHTYILSFL